MKHLAFFLLFILSIIGGWACGTMAEAQEATSAPTYCVPVAAENLKDLGNDWMTFDMVIDGGKHTYLLYTRKMVFFEVKPMVKVTPN